jgi:hypothetical protein
MKRNTPKGSISPKTVFLFDVDNTLLDNDRVIADLTKYLKREVGPERARCYWSIFERLRTRLGYADYLGALQRYRLRSGSTDSGRLPSRGPECRAHRRIVELRPPGPCSAGSTGCPWKRLIS